MNCDQLLRSACFLLASVAVCFAQNKATLFSLVTASGNTITLKWSDKHPWDTSLAQGGLELVAEFQTANGPVSRHLSKSIPAETRMLRFTLPDSLPAVPLHSVCLLFVMPNGRVLPIRQASSGGEDTSRFQFSSWEATTEAATARQSSERKVAALKAQSSEIDRAIELARADAAKQGFTSPSQCDNVSTRAEPLVRPYDAVAPDMQSDTARRICVKRANESEKYFNRLITVIASAVGKGSRDNANSAFVGLFEPARPYGLLQLFKGNEQALKSLSGKELALADEFQRDWARWQLGADSYEPQLRSFRAYLTWGEPAELTEEIALSRSFANKLNAPWLVKDDTPSPAKPTVHDVMPAVGAALDAYAICVSDGKQQLAINWDSWQRAQENQPRIVQAKHDFVVAACRKAFERINELAVKKQTLDAEIAQAQQALARLPALSTGGAAEQTLNQRTCSINR